MQSPSPQQVHIDRPMGESKMKKKKKISDGLSISVKQLSEYILLGECMMAEDSQIPSYSNTNLRQEAINKKKLKPFDNSPRAGISKKYIQAYGNMPVNKAPIEARRFLGVGNQNR